MPRASRQFPAVVAVTVGVLLLGWWFKAHCYVDGAWDAGEQYVTGCYTDVIPFWGARDVAAGLLPYLQTPLEYPVLTGAQIWLSGAVIRLLFGAGGDTFAFLALTSLLNGLLVVGTLVWLWRLGLPDQRLLSWVAAPPLVLYLGHNWDPLAIFLLVSAIGFHTQGRNLASGIAAGLGTAAKLFPGLVLPLIAWTLLRARDRRALLLLVGGAVGAWAVVNLPVAAAAPAGWWEFYAFSGERAGTFAALWTVADQQFGIATAIPTRNLLALLAFSTGAAVIAWSGRRRYAGREWMLLTPVLAWFLLTNKVYSPQFDLWLVPLLVLTLPRLWPFLAFLAADALVYATEFWHLAERSGVTPSAPYGVLATASLLRTAVLLWIIVDCLRGPAPQVPADGPPDEPDRAAVLAQHAA